MRASSLICAIACLLATNVYAQSKFKPLLGTYDFVAPSVYDSTTIPGAPTGLIVYDSYAQQFRGKGPNGATDWRNLVPGSLAVIEKNSGNSPYSMASGDDIVLVGSPTVALTGNFTLNLPSASNNKGHVYKLKKADSSTYHISIQSLDGAKIDGDSSTTLDTENETLTLVSDGTNWQIVDRRIPSEWKTYTPSGAWTGTYSGRWRRVGDSMEIEASFTLTSAPSGNFDIEIPYPSVYAVDSSKVSQATTANGASSVFGIAKAYDLSALTARVGSVLYTNSTTVRIFDATTSGLWSQSSPFTWASGDWINVNFKVPITGWNP